LKEAFVEGIISLAKVPFHIIFGQIVLRFLKNLPGLAHFD